LLNTPGGFCSVPSSARIGSKPRYGASGIGREANSGWAAYDLLTTLAENQLRLKQSAILDSVATFERIRSNWRFLAAQYGAAFRVVECVCSDRELRRRRLEVKNRGIPGWPEALLGGSRKRRRKVRAMAR